MIVLHIGFSRGFFLWGESSYTNDSLRRSRRPRSRHAMPHPWAASAATLRSVLSGLGFRPQGDPPQGYRDIRLATGGRKYPVPSTPLLGELPPRRRPSGEWAEQGSQLFSVDTLNLSVPHLTEFLMNSSAAMDSPLTESGRLLAPGVMMGLDLCYVAECHRMVFSLLERGRFLPDLRRAGEERYESTWRPLLMGEDAERFDRLQAAMPPILRFIALPERSSGDLLYELLGSLVDGSVRWSWNQRLKKNAQDEPLPGKRVRNPARGRARGRLVSSQSPYTLWIRSLGWSSETEEQGTALGAIHQSVRDWWDKFEWFARSPYKVCIALAHDEEGWRLDFSMRHMQSGQSLQSQEIWQLGGQSDSGASGSYLRRILLLSLGQIGNLLPAVARSLEQFAPVSCPLTTKEAAEFLHKQAAVLKNRGFCVLYPSWWKGRRRRSLTLRGRVTGRLPGGEYSLAWEPMFDGVRLEEPDAYAILTGGESLIHLKGGWNFIHPEDAHAVKNALASLPSCLSEKEALRFAASHPLVAGYVGAAELEEEYASLMKGTARVIQSQPFNLRGTLRQYQVRGYSWLYLLTSLGLGACLADDMGLGKTIQTLALIQRHRDLGEKRPVLLICPPSVLENWRLEIVRFLPEMTYSLHHGRRRAQGEDFIEQVEGKAVVLSTYTILQRETELYQSVDWAGIVLDEAQNIKNPDTLQARAARSVAADWRVALTGTPLENHVGDLWSLMEFLVPGVLGPRRRFTLDYVRPIQERRDPALMEDLGRRVAPFVMRRMKTDREIVPDLPAKIEIPVFCGLKKEQAALYASVTDELTRSVAGTSGIRRKGMVLAGLTRIKQICDHPALVTGDGDGRCERSGKMERLFALADEMFETGDRTLIFTQYVEMGHILKAQLQERFGREALFLHGGLQKSARDRLIKRFQEMRNACFFILSLRAGGVGINLTGANRVVLYDRWWNPAVEQQAIDRAYRIGQTRNVQVNVFTCRGTFEERIDGMISSKREVANRVIETGDNWILDLSDRDLREFLSITPGAFEA